MPTRPLPTATIGDILGTVLIGMVGLAFLVLTFLSVPRWWTTKFEFPPPMLVTFGLAGIASMAHRSLLRQLGAKGNFIALGCWNFPAPDEQALARVLTSLRDAGAVFPADDYKGLTVSDEFISLRERGLVSGSFCQLGYMGELHER